MTPVYCTLFDKNYLAFGVSLYRSIVKTHQDFKLYILCMDAKSREVLTAMNLPKTILLTLEDFPEKELQDVRPLVNHGQFCWLLQPFLCQKILKRFSEPHVIYLDSDCYFFSSADPLLQEIEAGKADITIVPHDFSDGYEHLAAASGIYCVQFNFFRNSTEAFKVLDVWKHDVLKYNKDRPHEYPGQISLDTWPQISPKVLILRNPLAGVAVWNAQKRAGLLRQEKPIFYHFHGLHFFEPQGYDFGGFTLSPEIVQHIYRPYLKDLQELVDELATQFPGDTFLRKRPYPFSVASLKRGISKGLVIEYYELFKRLKNGKLNLVRNQKKFLEGRPA